MHCRCAVLLRRSTASGQTGILGSTGAHFRLRSQSTLSVKELDKHVEKTADVEPRPIYDGIPYVSDDPADGPQSYIANNGEEYDRERMVRDVSRMYAFQRDGMDHVRRPAPRVHDVHKSLFFLRSEYAKYGRASGINPGVMWPSREQIVAIEERDKNLGVPTLQESWSHLAEKRRADKAAFEAREAEVTENMEKMPGLMKAYLDKEQEKVEAALAEKAKREKLLEEAKEVLGLAASPNDPRFQELLEAKEMEAKKALRRQKKKEKEEKAIARLTSAEDYRVD